MPRIHCPEALASGAVIALPPGAARHVQVLRMQPGDTLTLFDGRGGEFQASITRMGRSEVQAEIGAHHPVEREAPLAMHLAVGMPANERMDWLVEKAAELGAASIQPLETAHGVLRLSGERAQKKQSHWQAVAVAACEQCGRNRVPPIRPVQSLAAWLAALPAGDAAGRLLLAFAPDARPPAPAGAMPVTVLSGPEGGLTAQEQSAAREHGFVPVTLGSRVLRAETAPLAALAALAAIGTAAS